MLKKISHIGIAVKSLEEAIPLYRDVYGLELEGIEEVPGEKVRVAFFPLGETRLELLEPTSPESPIAKFIEKRGEGIHHIAYEVDQLEEKLSQFKENGIQLIHEQPKPGAHNMLIAFAHPKATGGVLTEFCEPRKE